MSGHKFDLEHRAAIYAEVAAGEPIHVAAENADVRPSTVREWLARGRAGAEGDEAFAEFNAVVEALQDREPTAPLDVEGLLKCASRSARRGSAAAQKLVWEILRNGNSGSPTSPLEAVDRIAAGRAAVNS
jgi:hypothetical protein